mgnify:CR=1 FL=1
MKIVCEDDAYWALLSAIFERPLQLIKDEIRIGLYQLNDRERRFEIAPS